MEVAMIGLHKRFCDESFFEKVYGYIKHAGFESDDIVLLVTCNRIEIYLASPFISERHPELIEKITQPFEANIEKHFYTFIGSDVLKHLAQVASGLDSLIYGESDIQHQVKKAYELMGRHLNREGHFLFQKALHISKKLRQEFDIKPLKSLVDQVWSFLSPKLIEQGHIVFVGNSDLNRKLYKKITEKVVIKAMLISSQKPEEGSVFQDALYVHYDQLFHVENVDGVICATKDRRLSHQMAFNPQGWVCDLSRPKVFMQSIDSKHYVDLNLFEQKSLQQELTQQTIRLKAQEYIRHNVKRLLDHRLSRFEPLVG